MKRQSKTVRNPCRKKAELATGTENGEDGEVRLGNSRLGLDRICRRIARARTRQNGGHDRRAHSRRDVRESWLFAVKKFNRSGENYSRRATPALSGAHA